MEWTGLNELREQFLRFFETKQHLRLPSFPLVPQGDKSLLLINSGMAPMKKWFLGTEEPPSHRVATCQKCIRTPDIESVGITDRHGTFFEMLGNFSFQNYFKREAIPWAWEFFTSAEWLAIPKDKLHISVYEEDQDAWDIWTREVGVAEDHMVRLGKADNFWEHGSGPCGPCSEIYFDRGEKYGCGKPDCKPGCDCDRFIEVWNLVFTEFDSDGAGHYEKLAEPNIDTGMGLERLACVMQDAPNLFETDTVRAILEHVERISGKTYGVDRQTDISIRVVTDHIRSTVFMVSDGILPSNEGRGYVLRRLLRRAARHGRMLGIDRPFLAEVCETAITQSERAYPELRENDAYIKKTISAEEDRFARTIDAGLNRLSDLIESITQTAAKGAEMILSGIEAFRLNDTFGFPLDLTREIAEEAGIKVDIDTFKKELQKQREKARADRASRDIAGWEADLFAPVEAAPTEFLGYDTLTAEARVVALSDGEELLDAVAADDAEKGGAYAPSFAEQSEPDASRAASRRARDIGHEVDEQRVDVLVVLDKTPFYAEGGGQVADTGFLTGNGARLAVRAVKKTDKGFYVHTCTLSGSAVGPIGPSVALQSETREPAHGEGHPGGVRLSHSRVAAVRVGDTLLAEVDAERRRAIMRNHTSAHLLQRALREVLGEHVHQAGSYVDEERMRFDFTHFSAVTPEELKAAEKLVNTVIFDARPVTARVMPMDEAKQLGAMALFGEKYGDTVRVVEVEGFSTELCGGTHVDNTAKMGSFRILSESSVAAGVRRIESTTGWGVLKLLDDRDSLLHTMAAGLKVANVAEVSGRVAALQAESKRLERELASLKDKAAGEKAGDLFKNPVEVGGVKVFTANLPNTAPDALRKMCDMIRDNEPAAVGALCGEAGGKLSLAVCCGKDAVAKGLKAGDIARQTAALAGGSGGGKPDFAMAGIKDAGKVDEALAAVPGLVEELLKT